MKLECNIVELNSKLLQIRNHVDYLKNNTCTVERQYYHYPNIQFVKEFNAFLNKSRDKKLENDWGMPIAVLSNTLSKSEFYKKYDDFIKSEKLESGFSFHTFMSNFIRYCFYNYLKTEEIKTISLDFFKIISKKCPSITSKIFSTGLIVKGNYKINDFLTITKPSKQNFDIKKIKHEQLFEYEDVIRESSSVIYHKYRQCGLGDNELNMQDKLKFILVLYKLTKIQFLGHQPLTFDFYDNFYGNAFFHYPRRAYIKTEFKKSELSKFKKTYDYCIKNLSRYDFNIDNHTGRLGIALQTFHQALEQLGSFVDTTPYAVKIINSLLIPERNDSKNKFVNRTFLFLYYLGIRNKKTKEILEIAYGWRNDYFHGAPNERKKKLKRDPQLTEKYVELFLLNSARLIIFAILISEQRNGEKIIQLIDNAFTIEGIKKLQSELSKIKQYLPIYKNGIKIKEDGLYVTITEC